MPLRVCTCAFTCVLAAREDAADDPVSGPDVLPLAVLWCHALHPDEREEAHVGLPCVWQESALRTPHYRWVSCQSPEPLRNGIKRSVYHLFGLNVLDLITLGRNLLFFLVDLLLLFSVAAHPRVYIFRCFGAWHGHVFAGFLWRSSTAAQTVMRSSLKKTAAGPQWNPRRKCRRSPLLPITTGWTVRHVMMGEGQLRHKMESNKIRIKATWQGRDSEHVPHLPFVYLLSVSIW